MLRTSIIQKRLYHINNIDETDYSKIVWERKEKLRKMEVLLNEGCSEEVALNTLDLKRSTYYRWKKEYKIHGLSGLEDESRKPATVRKSTWTKTIEMRVYRLRQEFPLWGKMKICCKYNQRYPDETLSESMVGRILTKLITQRHIQKVSVLCGKKETRKRVFEGHAQQWKYGMKSSGAGNLVQIDHMSVSHGIAGNFKHFNAICPTTKYVVSQVYKEANSRNAADFLEFARQHFPFPIQSIQVDGGSEFMAAFEDACFKHNISLFVLPPRRPQYNGNVERMNGTSQYEFYNQCDKYLSYDKLKMNLQKFNQFYNFTRPHMTLDLLTPVEFYEVIKGRLQSNMS